MEIRGNEGNIVEPCEQENFKTNCAPDESSELEVKCTNISNAKCVGILAEKIHDCVYLLLTIMILKIQAVILNTELGMQYA